MKKGFTIIEFLIVISIIVILVSMSVGAFSQFYKGNILEGEAQTILSIFESAKAKTLLSKGDSNYGVHLEADKVTLFKGSTYSDLDPDNEVYILSTKATLTSVIDGGGSDIIYIRLTGEVISNGTTTISLVSDGSQFKELVITKTGIIE